MEHDMGTGTIQGFVGWKLTHIFTYQSYLGGASRVEA